MIKKAVITAGGLGTRLLPFTKEMPKEMLPIFYRKNGLIYIKPLLQVIFENLYDMGVRNFCFIVGRGKRIIEDHFTPDSIFLNLLKDKNKSDLTESLESFYSKIEDSEIVWKNQASPLGFGDAVYKAKSFVGSDDFILWAGDSHILSKDNTFIRELIESYKKLNLKAILSVERVKNPEKFGIVIGNEISERLHKVSQIIEKPKIPLSNLASTAVYIFNPIIFKALEELSVVNGEKQLTDAVQKLIEWNHEVYARELNKEEKWIDIGNPDNYKLALEKIDQYLCSD